LMKEGVARELVNRIQNLRKDCKFEVTDKIRIFLQPLPEIAETLLEYSDYICNQTLATEILTQDVIEGASSIEWDEATINIKVEKIA